MAVFPWGANQFASRGKTTTDSLSGLTLQKSKNIIKPSPCYKLKMKDEGLEFKDGRL